jgi:hypothetical protein
MAYNTAWQGGNLNSAAPIDYFNAFNAADLNGLAAGSSVLSSIAVFDNTVAKDQFIDISFVGSLAAASTITAGQGLAFFLAVLQGDNVTLGDGRLQAGAQTAYAPILNPLGGFTIQTGTSVQNIAGAVLNKAIPPRKFALIMQSNLLVALNSSGNSCKISTYRQQTNN